MGRSQLWIARVVRLTGLALMAGFVAVMVVPLIIISYPGPEPYWNGYFRTVPLTIIILLALLAIPGAVLLFVGSQISPPDPKLDFWLDIGRFWKDIKSKIANVRIEQGGIAAGFTIDRPQGLGWTLGRGGKCFVEDDNDHLFLGQPRKNLVLIEPKTVLRIDNTTLQFDTGRWSYGKVTLFFDSVSDADTVEERAKKLLLSSQELSG